MEPIYRRTQTGHVIISFLTVGLILAGYFLTKSNFQPVLVITFILLIIVLYLFHSLTIEIDQEKLVHFFAGGFWKKKVPVDDIVQVEPVTYPWYYGWGIRLTPDGWLYNVSGLRAVEIRLKNGKKIRIGSNEPEKVKEVIDRIKAGP